MNKHIIIESCGTCPYVVMRMRKYYCILETSEVHKCEPDEIHKDCPLQDIPSREEAREIIKEYENCRMPSEDMLDRLGFSEGVK